MSTPSQFEIVRRGFYAPNLIDSSDDHMILFQGEELPEEARRLLNDYELLQAVMYVDVTAECWREVEETLILGHASFLDHLLKDWVETLGWTCMLFPGFVQHHSLTEEGKTSVYVAGRILSPKRNAKTFFL